MQVVDCRTLSRLELGAAAYVATPPTTPGSAPRPSARLARCGCVASACSLATTGVPAVAVKLVLVRVLLLELELELKLALVVVTLVVALVVMVVVVVVMLLLLLAAIVAVIAAAAARLPLARTRPAKARGKARAGGCNDAYLLMIPRTVIPATATTVWRHETQELDGQTLSR